ncbi:helix-turn-helix domain-containing protein [Ochrobactrum sp. GPK 3]
MITPRQIILAELGQIAKLHQVNLDDIIRRDRRRRIAKARDAVFWYVWFKYGYSLTKIGHLLSRNHATVLRGIGNHMHRCGIDHPWAELSETWKTSLKVQHYIRLEQARAA